MTERALRNIVRSCLVNEGFKIGDLSGVKPGDQIPLSWDLNDVHFVKKGSSAYTSDEKFSQDFPGGFPIRSAFSFSNNAPGRDDERYPSHLEDVLEALKGKTDTVYTVPEQDMQAYISDGSQIIAKSIIDDIDRKIRDGELPVEAKDARISIYVTPSSSQHAADYAESLRQNVATYIKSRLKDRARSVKERFSAQAYEECAIEIKNIFDSLFRDPRAVGDFYPLFNVRNYKDAIMAAREVAKKRIEANEAKPGVFPDYVINAYKKVRKRVNECISKINEFKIPSLSSVSAGRLTSTDVDVNRSFGKIPASQSPRIKADRSLIKQFTDQLNLLGANLNPLGELELDLSTITQDDLSGLSPYIEKRWKSWNRNRGVPQLVTVSDLIKDFEEKTSSDVPKWQQKIGNKPHFSISVVPSMQRKHISDFVRADESTLPEFLHIAIIADDNMESGITLREMRRAFDRISNMPNPPIAIYGAPLLVIRSQEAREHTHEKNYTGRRRSGIPVAAPLSNIPESSELYKKIVQRLAAMGNPNFAVAEDEQGEENVEDDTSKTNR